MTTEAVTEAPSQPIGAARRGVSKWARYKDFVLVPPIILALAVGAIFVTPKFINWDNISFSLGLASTVGIVVIGETIVLISGKMDLSLESTFGLAPAVGVYVTIGVTNLGRGGWAPDWLAIPLCLAVGVAVGVANGLMIVKAKLHGFIVTLAMLIALRGLQTYITGGNSMSQLPYALVWIGGEHILGLNLSTWIFLILTAIGIVVMGFTTLGRSVYAIGGNAAAARAAGIRVERVQFWVLVTASLLAAIAGLLFTANLGTVGQDQGNGLIFTVFAMCVIGGVGLNGGKGSVFGAFTGVVLLIFIQQLLSFAQVTADTLKLIYGLIILFALIVSRIAGGKPQE
jgi:simple sugar transport system permease protein